MHLNSEHVAHKHSYSDPICIHISSLIKEPGIVGHTEWLELAVGNSILSN